MKYIVDIHESIYNHFKNNEYSRQDVIAIHNSIMDAKPLDNVLDGIRAEIEQTPTVIWEENKKAYILANYFKKQVLKFIDKYRKGQE